MNTVFGSLAVCRQVLEHRQRLPKTTGTTLVCVLVQPRPQLGCYRLLLFNHFNDILRNLVQEYVFTLWSGGTVAVNLCQRVCQVLTDF